MPGLKDNVLEQIKGICQEKIQLQFVNKPLALKWTRTQG